MNYLKKIINELENISFPFDKDINRRLRQMGFRRAMKAIRPIFPLLFISTVIALFLSVVLTSVVIAGLVYGSLWLAYYLIGDIAPLRTDDFQTALALVFVVVYILIGIFFCYKIYSFINKKLALPEKMTQSLDAVEAIPAEDVKLDLVSMIYLIFALFLIFFYFSNK